MKRIETALGYELEKNASGVFLQKFELDRLNAKIAGPGEKIIPAAELERLEKTIKQRSAQLAQLEQQIKGISSQALTKSELEHWKSSGGRAPTKAF